MKFKEVIKVLEEGGTLFVFDNPLSYGLDDADGNSLQLHRYQAEKLFNENLVTLICKPGGGVARYTIKPPGYVTKNLKSGGHASFIGEPSEELLEAVEVLAEKTRQALYGDDFKLLSMCHGDDPGLDQIMGPPLITCPGCNNDVYQVELDQYGGTCGLCFERPEVEYKRFYGRWKRRHDVSGDYKDANAWECYAVVQIDDYQALYYCRRPWPYNN